jgi:hypothetical protein
LQSVVDLARKDLMRDQKRYVIDEREREKEKLIKGQEELMKNTTAIEVQN